MDSLQRRMVQEDTVQYKLFLIHPDGSDSQHTEEQLTRLAEEVLAKVAPLLMQHIWQHQPFVLKYQPEKGDVPAHIGGTTQIGDNVEDEWFIVYLLQQITEAFPQLVARVEDNDGEFLLIEAADYLPKWLNPDTSENRVLLYRGEFHILPIPSRSDPVGVPKNVVPTVAQALSLLSTHTHACRASPKICSALRKRLQGYPEKISTDLHRAHCFIPAAVATILSQRADLVAPAVSAFYLRDPVDLQACRSFKTFPPDTRVLTLVTFTRCLYAQLQQQQFTPDRRSGFTLPARSHPQYKAHELGMKLAHGFEILCSKCRAPSSEPDAPISCNPQWKSFLESLKRNGYFREEMEGSARYAALTRSAENFFKHSVSSKTSATSPGEEVLQLLQSCSSLNLEELKRQEQQLPQEDSDSWLNLTDQDLERLLQERNGGVFNVSGQSSSPTKRTQHAEGAEQERKETEQDKDEEEASYSLVAVSQGMKSFLNTVSSHEGAELPWSSSNQPFLFDPDSMASALDRLLGGKGDALDSDDESDDDDDDDDEEEEEEKEDGPLGSQGEKEAETLNGLRRYMDEMDEELMSTNVGQSFTQTKSKKAGSSGSDSLPQQAEQEETEEEIQPLDLDFNLITNLLESLSSQAGLAGPASNLLQSLGIHLPPNSDRS
ncbi:protein ecdysoneless homolog [Genypterus blacodes]|uniref:protein ecdysoneless homolog n=1 Tax=Genypterus blacodes TaxID=154954 RepID=UPI003F768885